MRHNTIISTEALHFGLWNFALFENTLDRSNCCGLVFSKGLLSVHLWPFFPDLDRNFTISHSQKCENSQLAKLPQNVKNVSNCCGPVFEKKKKKKKNAWMAQMSNLIEVWTQSWASLVLGIFFEICWFIVFKIFPEKGQVRFFP